MQNHYEQSNANYEYKKSDSTASYNQYDAMLEIEKQNLEKYEKFKTRLKEFDEISTLQEAKELSEKILPVVGTKCSFRVGNAKCTIINNEEMFRICVDTAEELISYDFA